MSLFLPSYITPLPLKLPLGHVCWKHQQHRQQTTIVASIDVIVDIVISDDHQGVTGGVGERPAIVGSEGDVMIMVEVMVLAMVGGGIDRGWG